VGGVPDVITCAKFQIEIFMGYDFTGGRIFDFRIDFSTGLTTVQRYCCSVTAQPVMSIHSIGQTTKCLIKLKSVLRKKGFKSHHVYDVLPPICV